MLWVWLDSTWGELWTRSGRYVILWFWGLRALCAIRGRDRCRLPRDLEGRLIDNDTCPLTIGTDSLMDSGGDWPKWCLSVLTN